MLQWLLLAVVITISIILGFIRIMSTHNKTGYQFIWPIRQ